MGYTIFSYAIDLKEIGGVFKSNDEELFANILQDGGCDCYPEGLLDEDIKVSEALRHIMFGGDYVKGNEHVYGYAFISICKYLRKELPFIGKIKLGYETSIVRDYLKLSPGIDFVIEKDFFVDKPQFGLPKVKDFPQAGILDAKGIEEMLKRLEPVNISQSKIDELKASDDEDSEYSAYAYAAVMGIKDNLRFCLDNNLCYVSFSC